MIVKDSKGREVEVVVGGRYRDDIQIESAKYDDGKDVPDSEFDYIMNHYADEMDMGWEERRVGAAEAAYDSARGH